MRYLKLNNNKVRNKLIDKVYIEDYRIIFK